MKIERKDSRQSVLFEEVKKGNFFEWRDIIYLKISYGEWEINAYDCIENVTTTFNAKVKVIPLSAKVVIE